VSKHHGVAPCSTLLTKTHTLDTYIYHSTAIPTTTMIPHLLRPRTPYQGRQHNALQTCQRSTCNSTHRKSPLHLS
jgi:hypothetical protein